MASKRCPSCFTSYRQPTPSGSATRAQRKRSGGAAARDFRRQRRAGQGKFGMWARGNVVGRGSAAKFAADMRGVGEQRAESAAASAGAGRLRPPRRSTAGSGEGEGRDVAGRRGPNRALSLPTRSDNNASAKRTTLEAEAIACVSLTKIQDNGWFRCARAHL
jgi:hypothetical protein